MMSSARVLVLMRCFHLTLCECVHVCARIYAWMYVCGGYTTAAGRVHTLGRCMYMYVWYVCMPACIYMPSSVCLDSGIYVYTYVHVVQYVYMHVCNMCM